MTIKETYNLEKSIWTESDFEIMGWHDCMIYGFAFLTNPENSQSDLLLDIDYIFEWIKPKPPAENFNFFVAPCTLIFHEMTNLTIDIETGRLIPIEIEISDLHIKEKLQLTDDYSTISWNIETHRGDINFEATGFTQYVRKLPLLIEGQQIPFGVRGGLCFDKLDFKMKNGS